MYLLFLHPVMANFFLSTFMLLLMSIASHAAANDVSDEFYRLRNIDNKTLLDKGYKCIMEAKCDSSMIYYSMVVNRYYDNSYAKKDLPDIIKAMQNLGIIYMAFSYDYKKSYEYLLEAKELAERTKSYEKLPNIYNCIANILQLSKEGGNSKDATEIISMLRKSFNMSLKLKDYQTLAITMNNLVTICFEKKGKAYNISREIKAFRKACAGKGKGEILQAFFICSAYEAYRQKDNAKAISVLEQAINTVDDNPLAYRGMLSLQGLVTRIYIDAKQYDKAIASINKAIDIARKNNCLDFINTLYHDLSDIYKEMGNQTLATKWELEYLRSNEKLQGEGQLSSVKNVKLMRELNKANEQVRELSAKRRLQNILFYCVLAVMAIIGGLLYWIYRANRKIHSNNRHLYRNYVEMLGKEEQARTQREINEKRIADLEAQLRDTQGVTPNPVFDNVEAETTQKVKYQNSRMTVDDTKELYSAVVNIMESSPEIYRLGFNVERLSELVHSRPRYVSQAINQEYGSNFNTLLNEYRIKEACCRLGGNPDYVNMTIEGIAESVGFKSRTSFGALFKSITGLSPSAYQKMSRME